jgi:hypothetical protein
MVMEKEIHFALGNPLRHLGIHEGRWALGPPPCPPPSILGMVLPLVSSRGLGNWERVNVHLTLGPLRVRRGVEQQFRKRREGCVEVSCREMSQVIRRYLLYGLARGPARSHGYLVMCVNWTEVVLYREACIGFLKVAYRRMAPA